MMKMARNTWMIAAAALAISGIAWGQVSIQGPGGGGAVPIAPPGRAPATATAPVATAPATATAPTTQTAAEVLQALLNGQPSGGGTGATGKTLTNIGAVPLIVPEGPPLGADGLLREGQKLEGRSGRLKKDGATMMFVFDEKEKPAYPPMPVVPSKQLASMEDNAGFSENVTESTQPFQIIAEVTQYRGKNYLYCKSTGIPLRSATPATKPAVTSDGPIAAMAPNVPPPVPQAQGSVISLRAARLVKDVKTGQELIAFDADGRLLSDSPMGVIPCKYLEMMEDATDFGNKPLKFIVSGEVTSYRGRNYIYLKYVKVVTDLGGGIGAGENPVTPKGQ